MRGDETLVERRALVVAVVVGFVGGVLVSVSGHPRIGLALFALAAAGFALELARGHLS